MANVTASNDHAADIETSLSCPHEIVGLTELHSTVQPPWPHSASAAWAWIPGRPARCSPWAVRAAQIRPQRNIESWADRLHTIFTGDFLHQLPLLEQAMGRQTEALVLRLDAVCRAADDLADAAAEAFASTPMPRS
jgi:hypothetical protein